MIIIVKIVVIGLAIFMALFLGLIVSADIYATRKYAKATRVQGIVCDTLGIEKVASYGTYQYRKYGKYLIKYNSGAGERIQELLIRNTKLQKGDVVEVRYVVGKEGVELVDNTAGTRLIEVLISLVIVMIGLILVAYFKM